MANNLLILASLGVLGGIFASGATSSTGSMAQPPAGRVAAVDSSARAGSRFIFLEVRQAPVPLMRNVRLSPASRASADVPAAGGEPQPQDDQDRKAAKAAAELDGYKRVSIVGKAGNGAWRAKAYRGTTEVRLTVDSTGRVSLD